MDDRTYGEGVSHPRWTWLSALGLVMIGMAPFLMLGAVVFSFWGTNLSEDLPFFLALIVLPWTAAYLVLRFGTWARAVAIIVALATAPLMFWTTFGLTSPASVFDFAPGLLVLPGVIFAVSGAIGSIVARRRGHLVVGRQGWERTATNAIVAVLAVLVSFSVVLTLGSRSVADAAGVDGEVRISGFAFDEDAYRFEAGSRLLVRNDDALSHSFTIDALGIDVALGPWSSEIVEIPSQPGTYVVYCRPHVMDGENPGSDPADPMASSFTIR